MNYTINLILILLLFSCAGKKNEIDLANIEEELNEKFIRGKDLFERGKYTRAKDNFDYIVLNDRGSEIGVEARYYQAESLFEIKQYNDAISSYERYLQYSNDDEKIEYCKFRICKSYYNNSSKYNRDQRYNDTAMQRLQLFIDDFPNSKYLDEAESFILELRLRKARKIYETGRLYLKEKEFDSAIIYFNDVIDNFYDTKFADDARISIIFLFLLKKEEDSASSYFKIYSDSFIDHGKKTEAQELLNKFNKASSWLSNFIRLYR